MATKTAINKQKVNAQRINYPGLLWYVQRAFVHTRFHTKTRNAFGSSLRRNSRGRCKTIKALLSSRLAREIMPNNDRDLGSSSYNSINSNPPTRKPARHPMSRLQKQRADTPQPGLPTTVFSSTLRGLPSLHQGTRALTCVFQRSNSS